jgi:hypothetical protein
MPRFFRSKEERTPALLQGYFPGALGILGLSIYNGEIVVGLLAILLITPVFWTIHSRMVRQTSNQRARSRPEE